MKVLGYTSPARGHLYPLVPILLELGSRGHQAAVRTMADEVGPLRRRGINAAAITDTIERIHNDDYLGRSSISAIKRSLAVFAARAAAEADDLRAAIAAEAPDFIIVDANCWGAAAAAETWGGPWASLLPYPAPLPSKDVPPFGPGLPPARHLLGRLRDRALRPLIVGGYERVLLPPLNQVRRSVGAPPVVGASDMLTRAPLTLYLTAEPFEYPRSDWPTSYKLIGPVSYDPDGELPAWLDHVDRPLVVVTTSTEFQDDGALVSAALDGLRNEDVFVVVTVPAGDPNDYQVPPNARVERFIPHSLLFPRTACVITHAGMGATQKALGAGVPVVAVPFGRDQSEVARRVVIASAGSRLPARRLSGQRLAEKVHQAMGCRAGALVVAQAFRAAGGAAQAVTEIETLYTADGSVTAQAPAG